MINYWPFIMAGGGGTRFWPKSRATTPKQFLPIVGDKAMITQTVDRLMTGCKAEQIFIITNEKQAEGTKDLTPLLPSKNIISEPIGRNTAPCVGVAAIYAKVKSGGNPIVGVFSADHVITPDEEFNRTVACAVELAKEEGCIVTLGITPSFPSTGYGYIEHADRLKEATLNAFSVKRFTEKPKLEDAKKFIESGNFSWNAGVFFFKASTVLDELAKQQPEIFKRLEIFANSIGLPNEKEALTEAYSDMPAISFDYAVMEGAKNVKVVEATFKWDDVGSWAAIPRHHKGCENNNLFRGDVVAIDSKNCHVESERLVALVGVSDLIVVETKDAVLVCKKNEAENVKKIVEKLREDNRGELL